MTGRTARPKILSLASNSARRSRLLASGDGSYDQKRLFPGHDGVGQRGVWRLVRKIFFARKEPQKWATLLRDVIANGAAHHRIAGLERIDHRALRGGTRDFELHLTLDARQSAQMCRGRPPRHA